MSLRVVRERCANDDGAVPALHVHDGQSQFDEGLGHDGVPDRGKGRCSMNWRNFERFALHVLTGAALAALAGVVANAASLGLSPQATAIIVIVVTSAASFIREKAK